MDKRLKTIIEKIVETSPRIEEGNSSKYFNCPFCENYKGVKYYETAYMEDIVHDEDCPWILSTQIQKEETEKELKESEELLILSKKIEEISASNPTLKIGLLEYRMKYLEDGVFSIRSLDKSSDEPTIFNASDLKFVIDLVKRCTEIRFYVDLGIFYQEKYGRNLNSSDKKLLPLACLVEPSIFLDERDLTLYKNDR